jgi:hypothetical protein
MSGFFFVVVSIDPRPIVRMNELEREAIFLSPEAPTDELGPVMYLFGPLTSVLGELELAS